MATKKDLVEAYSFSRRRLVTAFLSGAPGGREVEPARPGRTVVGGLALAVLLVAGGAIASVLASRTEEDWNKVGLVVSQQTSAQYVILKEAEHPTLIPVINVTSAQLILGADVTPTYVDQSVIEDQTPGEPIGIFGAPQLLPQPAQFIEQGWTSCTDAKLGMSLDLSRTERTSAQPGRGAVVFTSDPTTGRTSYYVIARSSARDAENRRTYAYPMPFSGRIDQALADVGLDDEANAVQVPEAWVRLFPIGGSLTADSFPIADFGQPVPADETKLLPPGATVGQYYESDGQSLVVTADGYVRLDPFSLAIYKQTVWGKGKQRQSPTPLTGAPSAQLRSAPRILDDAHWPDSTVQPVNGPLCAQLDVHADQEPGVELRSDPDETAAAPDSSSTGSALAFSIDRGQGAYVMEGDWDDTTSGSRVVVDPRGTVYTLDGADTITKLGYDAVDPPLVPDTWVKLMTPGVDLSTNAALCPPSIRTDPDAGLPGAPSSGASTGPSTGPSTGASADSSDSPSVTASTAPGAAPTCQQPAS